jgi:hypothetical protein
MGPVALSFDVTDTLPGEVTAGRRIFIAAWLFFPDDPAKLGAQPVTMTLLNGGSYDKRYFHIQIPGHPGYSAAEHLAALGNIVLISDHLGMGESTRVPEQKRATRRIVALANHAATTQFHQRLRSGQLHPLLPALPKFMAVGGGHSMGGMQMIVQQAEFRTYDALMILGYTTEGVHFRMGGKYLRAADFLPTGDGPDYSTNNRAAMHEGFHWEDVPAEVIAADDALAVPTPSVIGLDSIRTRIVAAEAAAITVPVYICLGERDVSPDPHGEPARYGACRDLTLHILPRSGHCQNFAGTRHLMWDRMHAWARSVMSR